MIENIQDFIKELCQKSGESELFAGQFRDALLEDEEILREFAYYMEHRDFACKAKVSGYTVVDVMVWQMDHFKARLDRDNSKGKTRLRWCLWHLTPCLKCARIRSGI